MDNTINPNEEIFRFPEGFKGSYIFGAVFWFVLGLIPAFLIVISSEWKWPLKILIISIPLMAMVAGWYCLWVVGIANDYIQVGKTGITYVPKKGQPKFLLWGNISKIRERDFLKQSELYDSLGKKPMILGYQLENSDRLRRIVYKNIGHLRYVLQKEFYWRASVYGSYVAVLLFCGGGAVLSFQKPKSELLAAISFVGIAAYFVMELLKEIRKVSIESKAVTLTYLLWKKNIPYAEISDILIENTRFGTVFIKQHNGKMFKLMGFKNGGIILFDALRTAWAAFIGKQPEQLPDSVPLQAANLQQPGGSRKLRSIPPRILFLMSMSIILPCLSFYYIYLKRTGRSSSFKADAVLILASFFIFLVFIILYLEEKKTLKSSLDDILKFKAQENIRMIIFSLVIYGLVFVGLLFVVVRHLLKS
jgi:hypothetical protein